MNLIMIQFYADTIKQKGTNLNIITDNLKTINIYAGFVLFLNVLITAIQWIILQNFKVDG
jgi:hypothetical protein